MAGVAAKNYAKIGFTVFQMFWIVLSLIIMFNSDKFEWMFTPEMTDCPPDMNLTRNLCFGTSLLMRMSFSLLCFHFLVFLILLGRNEAAAAFHDGCWLTKFLLMSGIYVGSFSLPNHFFLSTYMSLSKYASTIFLVYQGLLMLVVAYKINDLLVSNYEKDTGSCSGIVLVGVTLALTIVNCVWVVRQYKEFKCGYNITMMTATMVGIIAMYALVLLRARKDASILTSSIAAAYCLYLQWSALSSDGDPECNKRLGEKFNVW